jgi:hypothetical protein
MRVATDLLNEFAPNIAKTLDFCTLGRKEPQNSIKEVGVSASR